MKSFSLVGLYVRHCLVDGSMMLIYDHVLFHCLVDGSMTVMVPARGCIGVIDFVF